MVENRERTHLEKRNPLGSLHIHQVLLDEQKKTEFVCVFYIQCNIFIYFLFYQYRLISFSFSYYYKIWPLATRVKRKLNIIIVIRSIVVICVCVFVDIFSLACSFSLSIFSLVFFSSLCACVHHDKDTQLYTYNSIVVHFLLRVFIVVISSSFVELPQESEHSTPENEEEE